MCRSNLEIGIGSTSSNDDFSGPSIPELVLLDAGEAILLDAEDRVLLDAGEPVLLDVDLVLLDADLVLLDAGEAGLLDACTVFKLKHERLTKLTHERRVK